MVVRPYMHAVMPSVRFGSAKSAVQQIRRCWNLTLRHRWAHEASLLPFNTNSKLVIKWYWGLICVQSCPVVRFGSAESAVQQIRRRWIWHWDIAGHMRHHYYLSIPIESWYWIVVRPLYACSHAQCQIWQHRIWHSEITGHMWHHYYLSIPIQNWYWMVFKPYMHAVMPSVRFSSAKSAVQQIWRHWNLTLRHRWAHETGILNIFRAGAPKISIFLSTKSLVHFSGI